MRISIYLPYVSLYLPTSPLFARAWRRRSGRGPYNPNPNPNPNPNEGMATAQRNVVTATSHLGTRLRLERSQSGSLFVWERQAVPIDQTVQALVTG